MPKVALLTYFGGKHFQPGALRQVETWSPGPRHLMGVPLLDWRGGPTHLPIFKPCHRAQSRTQPVILHWPVEFSVNLQLRAEPSQHYYLDLPSWPVTLGVVGQRMPTGWLGKPASSSGHTGPHILQGVCLPPPVSQFRPPPRRSPDTKSAILCRHSDLSAFSHFRLDPGG